MERIGNVLRDIVKRILFLGFGIQIVLGTIWMCFNFPHLQAFSCNFGIFSGGLYTVCKRLYPLVYLLQIGFALRSGYFLCRVMLGGEKKLCSLFGSLVLLTFPFGLQCHLAVAPYSLICSFSLLLGAFLLRLCRGEHRTKSLVSAFGCLAALALLSRLNFWAGFCTVGLILTGQALGAMVRRKKTDICKLLMVFLALAGCIFGTNSLVQGGLVPTEEEVEYALFCRTVWPSLYKDRNTLPKEWKEYVLEYYASGQLTVTDFDSVLRRGIVETYGEKQAAEIFREMRRVFVKKEFPYLVKQCAGDAMGNVLLPLFYRRQLDGKWYASFLGRNYEQFLMHTPELSRAIAEFCMRSYPFFLILTGVLLCTGRRKKGLAGPILFAGIAALFAMLRGAGMLDGKETLAAAVALELVAVGCLFAENASSEETPRALEKREDRSCSQVS